MGEEQANLMVYVDTRGISMENIEGKLMPRAIVLPHDEKQNLMLGHALEHGWDQMYSQHRVFVDRVVTSALDVVNNGEFAAKSTMHPIVRAVLRLSTVDD